jgi:pimeloyl-ACP methyl ester carboxylesterase
MKKYIVLSLLAIIALASCKKEDAPLPAFTTLPRALVNVNQMKTEISKTIGTAASIVLVSGFGSEMASWENLYKKLNPNATVFTYNRAGVGLSENISGTRDAKTIAMELKTVLEANNIKAPYVLVAHSMVGIYARLFHRLNPGKVKGIVLVDATHENQLDSLLSMIPQPDRDMALAGMAAANEAELSNMPAGSLKEEFRANFATNYQQIRQYPAITNIPMYVITSTKVSDDNPPFVVDIHKTLHEQWAVSAGTKGKFITTNNSGHYIQVDEPGLVAEGIRWILSK